MGQARTLTPILTPSRSRSRGRGLTLTPTLTRYKSGELRTMLTEAGVIEAK